ncbi:Fanconi anemia group M protein-like [Spea bombifrons]|uniref:Fanconi anemia group M protein-like n=1 Tax=Spea bombifrons TaxID=233779 RepID=UPI00234A1292|nr:Fanconi anemia group M protein-like [Spea bombifrons]
MSELHRRHGNDRDDEDRGGEDVLVTVKFQLINGLKQIIDGCNYDLEMMAYLHKEDVYGPEKCTEGNLVRSASSLKVTKKLSRNSKGKMCDKGPGLTALEPDEDFMPLFKPTKMKDSKRPDDPGRADSEAKGGHGADLQCDNDPDPPGMDVCSEMDNSEAGSRTVTSPTSEQKEQLSPRSSGEASKSMTFLHAKPDSSCPEFNGDTSSVSSSMFYTPQSYRVVLAEFDGHQKRQLANILSNVKKFLSDSPPETGELDFLDDYRKSTAENKSCDRFFSLSPCEKSPPNPLTQVAVPRATQTDHRPTEARSCLDDVITSANEMEDYTTPDMSAAPELLMDPPCGGTDASDDLGIANRDASRTSSTNEPQDDGGNHDPEWDDIFDCDIEEAENDVSPTKCPTDKKSNGAKVALDYRTDVKTVVDQMEDSFDLFEDDLFRDIDQEPLEKSPSQATTQVNFNMIDPAVLLQDRPGQDCDDGLDKKIDEEDEFDCSGELFSVNFDLGFSLDDDDDDDDDEPLESESPEKKQKETSPDHFKVPSPPGRANIIGGNVSTPLTSCVERSMFLEAPEENISKFSPLQPTKNRFSLTPRNALRSASFRTPAGERLKTPVTPLSSAAKFDLETPTTPKTREKLVCLKTVCASPERDAGKSERRRKDALDASITIGTSPESEDDVVFRRKRKLAKANVLTSPESLSSACDSESPIPAAKKRRRVLDTPDTCDDGEDDDDDFKSLPRCREEAAGNSRKLPRSVKRSRPQKRPKHAARLFIDDEAELSSEGAEFVSSDEDVRSDNEQDSSLVGFLNDNTQLSQGLNDSEMHGIYLKSVRSPALANQFKMAARRKPSMAVFSQIPEQDESYMEDSFCVPEGDEELDAEEESSEEEVGLNFDLLQQESFVGGRKQYFTRRRLRLKGAQRRDDDGGDHDGCQVKKKKRIIIQDDSSEEENGATFGKPTISPPIDSSAPRKPPVCGSSAQNKNLSAPEKSVFDVSLRDRCQSRINLKASLSEELDFQPQSRPSLSGTKSWPSNGIIRPAEKAEDGSRNDSSTASNHLTIGRPGLVILADSREISSGPDVISCLKTAHGVKVEICSLGGCDYIVSNRLAVERKSQSDFANCANRHELVGRVKRLQSMFDRVCLIVEKDRVKPGETSRIFQRTKYYDRTLSSLIGVGVQLLFSSNQAETAGLLKELASLEQRKNMAIAVSADVKGQKQEVLQVYLSIPNTSYVTALNLCHNFGSVRQMMNRYGFQKILCV